MIANVIMAGLLAGGIAPDITYVLPSQLRGDIYYHEDNGLFYLPLETVVRRINPVTGTVTDFTPTGYSFTAAVGSGRCQVLRKSATRLLFAGRVNGSAVKCIEVDTVAHTTIATVDITPLAGASQALPGAPYTYVPSSNDIHVPFLNAAGADSYGRYKPDNSGHVLDFTGSSPITAFTLRAAGDYLFYTSISAGDTAGFGYYPVAGFPAAAVGFSVAIRAGSSHIGSISASRNLVCDYAGDGYLTGKNGTTDRIAKCVIGGGAPTLYTLAGSNQLYTAIASFDNGNLIVVNGGGDFRIINTSGTTSRVVTTGLSNSGIGGTVAVKKNSIVFMIGRMATTYAKLYRT